MHEPGRHVPAPPRHDGDLVRDPRQAVLVAVVLLIGVVLLSLVVGADTSSPAVVQALDDAWRRLVLAWPAPADSFGRLLELLGAAVVMVPLRVVVATWLALRRRWWDLSAWLLGWLLADLLTAVLKPGLARERPSVTTAYELFNSFPSGHAKTAAQVAFGLVFVMTNPRRERRAWYAIAATWVALMALSRTVLDHHWLSDVVAGSMLGWGCMLLVASTTRTVRDARSPPAPSD